MEKKLIAMTSITYAMKAKRLLGSMGYYCEIERTPRNIGSGCGYSIRIKNDYGEITDILDRNQIPYKSILLSEE